MDLTNLDWKSHSMDFGLRDGDLSWVRRRLRGAITHTYELEGRTSARSDALFSPTFMHRHTQFESFETFCTASPGDGDELHDLQDLPEETLDAFVSDTTDFDSWEGMKRSAAISNVMNLAGGQTPLPKEN
ncbi:MAG: hypothetical protein ACI9YT_002245 [Halobacteriales archaeon]|jgi:hypothetical protein